MLIGTILQELNKFIIFGKKWILKCALIKGGKYMNTNCHTNVLNAKERLIGTKRLHSSIFFYSNQTYF